MGEGSGSGRFKGASRVELQHKAADLILQCRKLNARMNTTVSEFNKTHLLLRRHRVIECYMAIWRCSQKK
jgi:hypothetical protein